MGTDPKPCRGCKELIYFVHTQRGKITPVNPDGTPHWATCPKAEQFRKARRDPVQEQIATEQKEIITQLDRYSAMSTWETNFIETVKQRLEDPTGNLSRKQASTLRSLQDKYCS